MTGVVASAHSNRRAASRSGKSALQSERISHIYMAPRVDPLTGGVISVIEPSPVLWAVEGAPVEAIASLGKEYSVLSSLWPSYSVGDSSR